jgi:hypothetical protein
LYFLERAKMKVEAMMQPTGCPIPPSAEWQHDKKNLKNYRKKLS